MMTLRDERSLLVYMKLAIKTGAFDDLLAHVLAAGNAHSTKLNAVGAWFFDFGYVDT